MKMIIGDDYYEGIYFARDEKYGNFEVPDEIAERWLYAEAAYRDVQDEALNYLKNIN